MGCRKIFKFVSLLTTLLSLFLLYVILLKPDFVLNPVKGFLNKPYASELEQHSDNRYDISNMQQDGEPILVLSEDQVFNLVNDKIPQLGIERIELKENKLVVFKNIAQKGDALWLIAEVELQEDQYKIGKIGFGRIQVPEAFKDQTINWISDKIKVMKETGEKVPFDVDSFFNSDIGVFFDPKYVKFRENEMEIELMKVDNSKFTEIIETLNPQQYSKGIEDTVEGVRNTIQKFNQ